MYMDFFVALSVIAKNQKQPKSPSAGEQLNKLRYFHTMKCNNFLKG